MASSSVRPFEVRGTGRFVAGMSGSTQAAFAPGASPADGVTLNFAGADIREVVQAMLGEFLGQNFVIDPKVQGSVTLKTSKPIPREALLPVLEQILRLNGAALVRRANLFEVVPSGTAISLPGPQAFAADRGAGQRLQVIPLTYVAAKKLEPLLKTFAPTTGMLYVDPARNMLIVSGTESELQSIAGFVAVLDIGWLQGMSFALHPLKEADAASIVAELEEVLQEPDSDLQPNLVRFLAIERLNAVLVITKVPAYLDISKEWVKRLDQGGADEERIFVYHVQNRRAKDLANVLGRMFGAQPSTPGTVDLRVA